MRKKLPCGILEVPTTMDTMIKPPGLYLHLVADREGVPGNSPAWEEKCGHDPTLASPCLKCGTWKNHTTGEIHDTGTRHFAVEGDVEIYEKFPNEWEVSWSPPFIRTSGYWYYEKERMLEEITGPLTAAFRANTLPAELLYDPDLRPWGLRQVEVQHDPATFPPDLRERELP